MGRPRKTDFEKKLTSQARQERYKAKLLKIGDQLNRWIFLRNAVGGGSDTTLAKLLIDKFLSIEDDGDSQNDVNKSETVGTIRENQNDRYLMSQSYGHNQDVIIKTEPPDTYGEGNNESKEPEHLQMDCESVIDNDISLVHDENGVVITKSRPLVHGSRGQSGGSNLVDLHYVHGIPINEPFNVQYFSPKLGTIVESKVYMVVEYSTTEMNPIKIGILGQILEIASMGITSKTYQDFSKSSISSCVDISSVGTRYPSFTGIRQDARKKQNPVTCETRKTKSPVTCETRKPEKSVTSGTRKTENPVNCETHKTEKSVTSRTRKTENPVTCETRVKLKERLKKRGANEKVVPDILNDTNDVVVKQEYMLSGNEWDQSNEGEKTTICEQRNSSNYQSTSDQEQKMEKFEERSKENVTHSSRIWSEDYQENYAKQDELNIRRDVTDNNRCDLEYVHDSSSTSTADELDAYLARSPFTERNSTEDIISDILNDTIDMVVKQQMRERKERRIAAKRKSEGSQSPLRQQKLIKFEDGSEENTPHSSRIRSKGYRINYAELDELQPPSDLSDDDKSDLDYMLDDASTDDPAEPDDCQVVDESNDSTTPKPKVKNEDPDFLPDSDPDFCPEPSYKKKIPKSSKKKHLSTDDSDAEERQSKRVKKQSSKKQKTTNDDKDAEERHLKRVRQQKSRITVILSEHTDKYYLQEQVSIEMKNRSKADAEKSFQLMVCGQCHKFRTEDKKQMETHLENHINGDFSCPKCDFQASGLFEMYMHKNKNHGKFRKCKLCSTREHKVVFKSKDFREHYMQNHKDKLNQCSLCGQYSLSKSRHRCPKLSAPFVQCDICGKEMKKFSLATHRRRVHFNVRPFPCSLCKYSASSPFCLESHMQARHEGVHNNKCDLCDFTCVRPAQLTSHMRTHTGHKPYQCDSCPFAAAWNVQLKEHRKLHEGLAALGKPCEICSIVVREGAPYTKHLRKEHGQDV